MFEEKQLKNQKEVQIYKVKLLKEYLEEQVSKKYQNRKVNITGCRF